MSRNRSSQLACPIRLRALLPSIALALIADFLLLPPLLMAVDRRTGSAGSRAGHDAPHRAATGTERGQR